jgi:hypothetical protein
MNWLGFIAVLALAAIILSVVTDVEMTAYAMVYFCTPDRPATTAPFEYRFRGDWE